MSNLLKHAEREFGVLGWPGTDEMQKRVCNNILELLKVFSKQGHSGTSANYVLHYFMKLADFKPISPLTGADHEWNDIGGDSYQNNRCSAVFKDKKTGKAYWIYGKIFREPNGSTFTSSDSRVEIEFPWTEPESEIIDVARNSE